MHQAAVTQQSFSGTAGMVKYRRINIILWKTRLVNQLKLNLQLQSQMDTQMKINDAYLVTNGLTFYLWIVQVANYTYCSSLNGQFCSKMDTFYTCFSVDFNLYIFEFSWF